MRSSWDEDCYLAAGNMANQDSLQINGIDVMFDCEDGGNRWIYEYGSFLYPNWSSNIQSNDDYQWYISSNLSSLWRYNPNAPNSDRRLLPDSNETWCSLNHTTQRDIFDKSTASNDTIQVEGYAATLNCNTNDSSQIQILC